MGESDSPGLPPIVPRIPEMLFINATYYNLGGQKYGIKSFKNDWIQPLQNYWLTRVYFC